ncbi:hypothetical protein, partial [Klebsiella aerogenes]|uniref:hypothetical protein n=1 Tax=Klebsiella aerogenes TaxID=548 RepID=UPI001954FC20
VFGSSIALAMGSGDVVGNRWRTLALGIVASGVPLSIAVFPFYYNLFNDISGVVAADSVLLE